MTTSAAELDDGRQRLRLLLTEAQRFHDSQPRSKRRSAVHPTSPRRRRSDGSSASLGASLDSLPSTLSSARSPSQSNLSPSHRAAAPPEQWDVLREHLDDFWRSDSAPPTEKYALAKHWLTAMRLWDVETTWAECQSATMDSFTQGLNTRHAQRLRALPPGRLFF